MDNKNKKDENFKGLKFKADYQKVAEENSYRSQNFLNELYKLGWALAEGSSTIIDRRLQTPIDANDTKRFLLLIILRNCISDLCSCLDSLERGHERTILNNLRMSFEDFCCVIDSNYHDEVYQKVLEGKHQASSSIGSAKKLRPNDKKFNFLYGELSKISHHMFQGLIARQMQTKEGLLSHLKLINPERLEAQKLALLIVIDFLRSIGELAEEL